MISPRRRRSATPKPTIRAGYWFLPKAYGYGAYPATVLGWVTTALYVAAIGGVVAIVSDDAGRIVAIIGITIGWLALVATRTDGGFGWRWGGR